MKSKPTQKLPMQSKKVQFLDTIPLVDNSPPPPLPPFPLLKLIPAVSSSSFLLLLRHHEIPRITTLHPSSSINIASLPLDGGIFSNREGSEKPRGSKGKMKIALLAASIRFWTLPWTPFILCGGKWRKDKAPTNWSRASQKGYLGKDYLNETPFHKFDLFLFLTSFTVQEHVLLR